MKIKKMSYPLIFERNLGAITFEEQMKLKNAPVAIIGLGGIGGIAFEMLARAGVGNFILIDNDKFEISNLNRQTLSSVKNLGKRKSEIASEVGKEINPEIKIKKYCTEFNEKNSSILKNVDVIVDGLDNLTSRIILSRVARKLKIPYVFGAAEYSKGISTVFLPREKTYENIFARSVTEKKLTPDLKKKLAEYQRCQSVLGVVPNMIGCFEAMQAVNLILKKPIVKYPEFLHVDMFSKNPVKIGKI